MGWGGGVSVCEGGRQAGSDYSHGIDFYMVYLERSDSILRRKANKLSAPLNHEAEPNKKRKELKVRSIVTHPTSHAVFDETRKLFHKGREEKLHYVRTITENNIRPFITRHGYVR